MYLTHRPALSSGYSFSHSNAWVDLQKRRLRLHWARANESNPDLLVMELRKQAGKGAGSSSQRRGHVIIDRETFNRLGR